MPNETVDWNILLNLHMYIFLVYGVDTLLIWDSTAKNHRNITPKTIVPFLITVRVHG